MAMFGKEFKEWAATIGDDDEVAVDNGGLCLVVSIVRPIVRSVGSR